MKEANRKMAKKDFILGFLSSLSNSWFEKMWCTLSQDSSNFYVMRFVLGYKRYCVVFVQLNSIACSVTVCPSMERAYNFINSKIDPLVCSSWISTALEEIPPFYSPNIFYGVYCASNSLQMRLLMRPKCFNVALVSTILKFCGVQFSSTQFQLIKLSSQVTCW